ncbi:acyl-CoA synthetase [Pseudoclavibacter endophyticus]|uniref:Alpha/beta fold hydrolase n=1 Tax=Pseudoclavibacter endophyticus TaxID=1778590 RepID=A0A6H9WWA8_9MICO|nr:alpha/beta fold hydrolase [Pseudoclavibacter endophyticus]KAB1650460.1 alpha/beta fold hydrolase [Pseudoclavibacter endophyticus]GGA66075.1 acyl-CoA synthetase [Pseudoclavibacter endophyticus]
MLTVPPAASGGGGAAGPSAGDETTWHYLDTGDALAELGAPVVGTVLAVHGNPTWSYLWRSLVSASVAAAEAGRPAWRVVAVDQLEMGFSQRSGEHRTLARRVADLGAFTDALGLGRGDDEGGAGGRAPVVTIGHDWGGVISLGWAIDHPHLLAGVALLNTAVHQPAGTPIPAPLRLARARGVLEASAVATTAFLDTTLTLASPPLARSVKAAYRAPYRTANRRRGIGGFVRDIPVDAAHPSVPALTRIAAGVADLAVPGLMLWGPNDPIFSDRYLDDLTDRLPRADVHRFEGASHLIAEERPYAEAVLAWLEERVASPPASLVTPSSPAPRGAAEDHADAFRPIWHGIEARADDDDIAVIDMAGRSAGARGAAHEHEPRRVTWRQLATRVNDLAAGLHRLGVRRGDRVSVLVQPGPTLTAVLYACLRIGAVVVVADAGLGVSGLTRAVRGAWPDVIIGGRPGLAAARALGWPGIRIAAEHLPRYAASALGVSHSLRQVATLGAAAGAAVPAPPGPEHDAAILFTSGSTGPAKGVVYTHRQLAALRDGLAAHFDVTPATGLVTGFAPFALLGPALGTRSVTPDMDVSSPRTLTARAVAAALRASGARIVFLSPAAMRNVVETARELTPDDRRALERVRTFLSTGAPIGASLLARAAELMPNATPHTPYGMTECLLVTDVTLDGILSAADAPDEGVCVGTPIGEARVLVSALDGDGRATGAPSDVPGVLGELVVSAPHLKSHYDRLWITDREAVRGTGTIEPTEPAMPASRAERWHRTGDIGHLDEQGRVWVEGRVQHVIVTADGPVAPVGPEQAVESAEGVRRAAVVGVGPQGLRQAVAVVETESRAQRPQLADAELAARIRAKAPLPLAAVFVVPSLPTDIRHNSKIDRTRLAAWADATLAGRSPEAP